MKIKTLLGIFFFLALITTTVFGFTAENSRQSSNQNFSNPHQGFILSKAAPAPGFLACFLDSSRQGFLLGQSGNELEKRLKQVGNLDPTKRLDQLLKGTGKLDALKRDPNLKVPSGVESLFTKSLKEIANLLNNSQWKTFTKHLFRGGSDITHGL